MPISLARSYIRDEEIEKLGGVELFVKEAMKEVEENGIVFIDEIDKICCSKERQSRRSGDASNEGVQRDLLPLLEGCTISTKYGPVNTSKILFIASGSFHSVPYSPQQLQMHTHMV